MQRLFLAAPLTGGARQEIKTGLPDTLPGRAVPPENWHLTVRFLGDTAPDQWDRLVQEMERAPLGAPFEVRFGQLGAFPNAGRARVLWLGIAEGEAQLQALAAAAEDAAGRAGFAPADKSFAPHLTLSRIRPPRSVVVLLERTPPLDVRMPVDEVVLYRSQLGRGPVRYEPLARFPLA